jgi:predicted P-loop ATPase
MKPESVQGDLHRLPAALAPLVALPHWVCWRWERPKDKWTKVPYQPDGRHAKNNDAKTWSSYEAVIAAVSKFDGIGFCLLNGNIAAFDIDHCRDASTGEIDPWAAALVGQTGSYSEVTVSGTGLRIIGFGEGERLQRKLPVHDDVSLEAYRRTERYIVITGNPLPESKGIINIDEHLDATVAELEAKKAQGQRGETNKPGTPEDGGHHARQPVEDEEDKLDWTIKTGGDYREVGKRSDGVWYVINEMLRRGYLPNVVVETLLDRAKKISDHVYDQSDPRKYAARQVARAKKEITLSKDDKDIPYKTQDNIRIALLKLGVTLRYDEFADRVLLDGLADFGPVLDDAALDRFWLLMERRFRLSVPKDLTRTVVTDTARLNKFHPIRDYLASLKWDGVERLDKWLTTYGGVEDNEYSRAVGALFLIAAVRRIRNPGCKFDEMVIFEQPVQGTDKSTALSTLAVKEEWFSDDLPLNIEGKQVIEALRGRWIIEAGELSGMRRADIGHLKSFLSRQVDRARLAYGRIVSEVPRQCVIAGTTNEHEYLKDTSGNRRYWPVRCQKFDIAALRRDRDQLWAEAVAREATGVSIRLALELWPQATVEQSRRLTQDPWVDSLKEAFQQLEKGDQSDLFPHVSKKISMGAVWTILDVRGAQQTQEQSRRVGDAMRKLGWRRPNDAGTVKIEGEMVSGFVKGEKPWKTVTAHRSKEGFLDVRETG